MNSLLERKGYTLEAITQAKKKKQEKKAKKQEKKAKTLDHVKIIDDDAPVPWNPKTEKNVIAEEELISVEDAPIVVGIIDDRPPEIREKERFKETKKWRAAPFEEIPDPSTVGPQPKPSKSSKQSSHERKTTSDDSDPELDRNSSMARKNESDSSPPRRKYNTGNHDPSPPRIRRRSSDDDPSPPRKRDLHIARIKKEELSPPRRHRRPSNDDPSPPRKRDLSQSKKEIRKDRDQSPRSHKTFPNEDHKKIKTEPNDESPRRKHKHKHKRSYESSPSRDRDSSSSKRYSNRDGNQSERHHRDKSSSSRKHSPHMHSTRHYQVKDEPISSTRQISKQKSPDVVPKVAKSERTRLAEHKEQIAERYATWGRGVAQVRQTEDNIREYLEQAQKPLARYRDDSDLDHMLKQREREDDPMLKYLTNKPEKTRQTADGTPVPVKPRYKGPDPQKNRFDIWPGYRWDGVDRSNGYEKKLFESIAARHAKAQEAYLWSVEDM